MDQPVLQNLLALQKTSSLKLIGTQAKRQDLTISEIDKEPLVFAHWMSLLLISSPQIKVTFKAHFMLDTARQLSAPIYNSSPEQVSVEKATDFFREFCSLVGGDVKIALINNGVRAVASLPILAKGFDGLFFTRPPGSFVASWTLGNSSLQIFCSTQMEIMQDFKFEGGVKDYEDQKGEIEFF